MSRSVKYVYHIAVELKLHGGRGNGYAPLLFYLHPVGYGVLCCLSAFNSSCQVYRTSVEQKFLCECGLARIGVGNNGKGSSFFYLFS